MLATHRSNHDSQPQWLFLKKQFQAVRMLKIFTLPATRGISCSGIGDLYSQVKGKIVDRAPDASTVCSNGLSYILKKGDRKAEEKKQ